MRPAEGDPKFTNMFVKNLPDSVDEAKLRELCEAHGEVGMIRSSVGDCVVWRCGRSNCAHITLSLQDNRCVHRYHDCRPLIWMVSTSGTTS